MWWFAHNLDHTSNFLDPVSTLLNNTSFYFRIYKLVQHNYQYERNIPDSALVMKREKPLKSIQHPWKLRVSHLLLLTRSIIYKHIKMAYSQAIQISQMRQ